MPRGDKGKRFEKGHPGMGGRPKMDPELKKLRTLNRQEVEKLVNNYWMLDEASVKKKLDHPLTPIRDKLVLRVILRGIAKGDYQALGFLTDFIFGARPKELKVENSGTTGPQVVVMLPPKDS